MKLPLSKVTIRISYTAEMRIYLFIVTGCGRPHKRIFKSAFLFVKFENLTTGKPPQIYETELQLFQKKCEVKLHEHLNSYCRKEQKLSKKTGKTCEAD
jgi:hypothetical protein